ncbi:MBOAT family O-acyltransferase [Malaciobacter mytili]|uniref:MBOAT family O-acyltransferase n=1 Tax=Malaciobacter mytili TaxID=603050 RepID=UPI00100B9C81|nr:MBOAT family protein [Malaciobacter mytili]
MQFHSFEYAVFLVLIVISYYLIPHRFRWGLLLAASYFFYGAWRIDFLLLLVISTLTDFILSIFIEKEKSAYIRKVLLIVSLSINLGLLFIFKYIGVIINFIIGIISFENFSEIDIILPLGISFYTFQTISYTVDVYRKRIPAEKHIGYYALYVAFFPQLLAGPIERASMLLKQFKIPKKINFTGIKIGYGLILFGLFKKIVIADSIDEYFDPIRLNPQTYNAFDVFLAAPATIYQYYCDLSGYADIAIGSALLLGIQLSQNFDRPFAATSTRKFWYKWHITVTSWFRDYLLRQFTTKDKRSVTTIRPMPLILTGLLIGLWHGAQLGWIIAGISVGVLSILESRWIKWKVKYKITPKNRFQRRIFDWIGRFYVWIIVFFVIGFPLTWENFNNIQAVINQFILFLPTDIFQWKFSFISSKIIILIIILELWQWLNEQKKIKQIKEAVPFELWWFFQLFFLIFILNFAVYGKPGFLYFKF